MPKESISWVDFLSEDPKPPSKPKIKRNATFFLPTTPNSTSSSPPLSPNSLGTSSSPGSPETPSSPDSKGTSTMTTRSFPTPEVSRKKKPVQRGGTMLSFMSSDKNASSDSLLNQLRKSKDSTHTTTIKNNPYSELRHNKSSPRTTTNVEKPEETKTKRLSSSGPSLHLSALESQRSTFFHLVKNSINNTPGTSPATTPKESNSQIQKQPNKSKTIKSSSFIDSKRNKSKKDLIKVEKNERIDNKLEKIEKIEKPEKHEKKEKNNKPKTVVKSQSFDCLQSCDSEGGSSTGEYGLFDFLRSTEPKQENLDKMENARLKLTYYGLSSAAFETVLEKTPEESEVESTKEKIEKAFSQDQEEQFSNVVTHRSSEPVVSPPLDEEDETTENSQEDDEEERNISWIDALKLSEPNEQSKKKKEKEKERERERELFLESLKDPLKRESIRQGIKKELEKTQDQRKVRQLKERNRSQTCTNLKKNDNEIPNRTTSKSPTRTKKNS